MRCHPVPEHMTQDHGRLYGALFALRILARKYEFKDEEDRAPLTGIVNGAFPVLLQLFQVGHFSLLQVAQEPSVVCRPGNFPSLQQLTVLAHGMSSSSC